MDFRENVLYLENTSVINDTELFAVILNHGSTVHIKYHKVLFLKFVSWYICDLPPYTYSWVYPTYKPLKVIAIT